MLFLRLHGMLSTMDFSFLSPPQYFSLLIQIDFDFFNLGITRAFKGKLKNYINCIILRYI